MGVVVTSSSLSTLLFVGYTALAFENPDFEGFHLENLPGEFFLRLKKSVSSIICIMISSI